MWTTQKPEYQGVWFTVRTSRKEKQNSADDNVSAEFDHLLPPKESISFPRFHQAIALAGPDQPLEIIKYFLPRSILMT